MRGQSVQLVPRTQHPYNAETPMSALIEEVTPTDLVYVRNHFDTPRLDAAEWSLDVMGSVERPISVSYADIQGLPTRTLEVALECAGNGRRLMDPEPKGTPWGYGAVSIVQFTGTPLLNVLNKASIAGDVVEAVFEGADRGEVEPGRVESFTRSLPIDVALDSDTLLTWGMNGQPLSPEHGYPLRLVVPGWYGMASVKWLKRVTLLAKSFRGFFQNEHYVYLDEEGAQSGAPVRHIRTRSLILSPTTETVLRKGEPVTVLGIAWSGLGAIARVEFSADGGHNWTVADLDPSSSAYGVQRWRYRWKPEKIGSYTLATRGIDSLGNSQPSLQRWNRLGYGNNGPQAVVVAVE